MFHVESTFGIRLVYGLCDLYKEQNAALMKYLTNVAWYSCIYFYSNSGSNENLQ